MVSQDEFDEELEKLLREMEKEGRLVPFLLSLGDVYSELSEELNNEVLTRLTGDEEDDEDE